MAAPELKFKTVTAESFARMQIDAAFRREMQAAMLDAMGITPGTGQRPVEAWLADLCEYNELPYNRGGVNQVLEAIARNHEAQLCMMTLSL